MAINKIGIRADFYPLKFEAVFGIVVLAASILVGVELLELAK